MLSDLNSAVSDAINAVTGTVALADTDEFTNSGTDRLISMQDPTLNYRRSD